MLNEFKQPFEFIRDNYYGNGGYDYSSGYSYLRQHPRELPEFYKDRKESIVLENLFQPLQDLFLDPIVSQKIDITTNNVNLKYIFDEIKLMSHSSDSLLDFKLYGKCFFSVYTDVDSELKADTKILPDINKVFPADIIKVSMNGRSVADCSYKEYEDLDNIKIPILVTYQDNYFDKKTLAWRDKDNKITLEDLGEELRIKDFDSINYGVLNKIGAKLDFIPKTFNLAQIQKQLFNLDSQRLDILRKCGFPVLVVSTDEEVEEICLSENMILRVPAEVRNLPEYLESQLEGVSLTGEIVSEKKSTIYKIFTNGLFSDNIKYTSTMSSLIATKSFKSTVDTLYQVYQEIINKMVDNIIFIYGISTNYSMDFPKSINLSEDELKEQIENVLE